MRKILEFLVDRWGLGLFVVVVALGWGHQVLALRIGTQLQALLAVKQYCYYYIALYAGVLVLSWASYSKIYKSRVFLLGPMFMVVGIYAVMYLNNSCTAIPHLLVKPEFMFFKRSILAAAALILVFLGLLPTYMEYRTVRKLALLAPVVGFVLLTLWFRYYPLSSSTVTAAFTVWYPLVLQVLAAIIIFLSLVRVHDDNRLGGAFAGLAVFILMVSRHLGMVQGITFFLVLPFVLGIIIFYNWFHSLYHRARYDPLLRIYNRDYYQSIVEGKADFNLGKKYCIAVCDLDHFKRINDRAGHQAGDVVLKGTAQAIKHFALPKGITCRYGGEELVIFFRRMGLDEAKAICETIRQKVALLDFRSGRRRMSVTVSIGVAARNPARKTPELVVGAADKAVYKAKRTGRNKVVASK